MSQFPPHRITNSDDVRTGNAVSPNRAVKGVPLAGAEAQATIVVNLGAPEVADVDGICAAQAIAGAADADIDGILAVDGVVTMDVPRGVQVDSSGAGDTTQTVTIYGTDVYGQAMQEEIALNGVTDVLGLKAFATVTRVAVSAALAGNLTVGTTKKIGLPYRPVVGGFIRGRLNEDTADAGTYAAPERTASTATTADVRGTYLPAGTLDGTNEYTVVIAVANGPTDAAGFGIAQFNG
jgi:hypothetical protein